MRRGQVTLLLLAMTACGSDKPAGTPLPSGMAPGTQAPHAAAPAAPARAAAARSGEYLPPPTPLDPSKEALLLEARKRVYRNEDFVESERNRDPFHPFLGDFNSGGPPDREKHKVLMDRFALEELRLVAIVGEAASAPAERQAMFVDSTGFGVMVGRGDHISRADAKITHVTTEHVVLEFKEDLGNGNSRLRERTIELHAGEPASEQGHGDHE